MMTWSINWDAVASCNGAWSYATNYQSIFGTTTATEQTSDNSDKLLIYPNPAANVLNIECSPSQNLMLTLFNLMGEPVMQRNSSGTKESVDISFLPSGMYIIKVSGGDREVQRKVVKE
jgi:hypothetical protein